MPSTGPNVGCPPLAAPMPETVTSRMRLNRFCHDDLEELEILFAKQELWHFPYGRGFTKGETKSFLEQQITHWDRFGVGCWLARLSKTDRIIGYVGLSVPTFLPEILPALEVGWRFDPEVWGLGYASEGARAALDLGFRTLELNEICSIPQNDNPRSWRVCDRLGMTRKREVTLAATDRRSAVTAYIYTVTADDWNSLHPS